MKFILIIWFSAHAHGASSTVVDGFTTLDGCETAKEQIISESKKNKTSWSETVRGFCVETGI